MYCTGTTLDDDRDVYGRRALLQELAEQPARWTFLAGLRRSGKTATLLWLERWALRTERFVPVRLSPEGISSGDELRNQLANALSRRRKLLPELPGGFLKLRRLPLLELMQLAEAAAEEADTHLWWLFDELDAIARLVEQAPEAVRHLRAGLPQGAGHRVLATGSRRALRLRRLPGESPLLGGFSLRTLPPTLDAKDAEDLVRLTQRNGAGAVRWSGEQIAELVARTGGHPYLIQAACQVALQLHCGPDDALRTVLASHESEDAFRQDLERFTASERAVLDAAMEGRQPDPTRSSDVRTLVELGVLDGSGRLTVPVLGELVRNRGWTQVPVRLQEDDVAPQLELVRELGSGTFGSVFLARRTSAQGVRRLVAVKLLKREWEARPSVVARLRDEARMLALMHHRAVVRAEDIVRIEGQLGVVMEYVPGADLHDLLSPGPLPPRAAVEVVAEVADALHAAWTRVPEGESGPLRVLHRDLKPHNLRLTRDGDLKVLDFGVASARFGGREVGTMELAGGTLRYMGPERHAGVHDDPASDVFSLGVVLHQLVTGVPPDGPWPTTAAGFAAVREPWLDKAPAALRGWLNALTSYAPSQRPTAGEVAKHARASAPDLPGPGLRGWAAAQWPEGPAAGEDGHTTLDTLSL